MQPPLLVVAPIEPCATGNGLAMRLASFVQGATAAYDVHVCVVPVAGSLPGCPIGVTVPVTVVVPPDLRQMRREISELLARPLWRSLLAAASPMPPLALAVSPALAGDVIAAIGATAGTPVHAFRSYMAPLASAVAERLASPWSSLDLDDDDEGLAASQGDTATAAAYHRLVATFARRFSSVSLASPTDSLVIERRHGLPSFTVPNAISIPPEAPRRPSYAHTLLFVANLGYRPNVEAAVSLVDHVLPALQAGLDRPVRVVLVGSYPADGPIAAYRSHPAVTATGFVDDVGDYYSDAAVVVAPFTSGSGTRIKLLEAFAHRVPVVTTPVGASGLAVRDAEHLLMADNLDDLVAATATVLGDPVLARRLSSAALEYVRCNHSPPVVAEHTRSFLASAARASSVRG